MPRRARREVYVLLDGGDYVFIDGVPISRKDIISVDISSGKIVYIDPFSGKIKVAKIEKRDEERSAAVLV